MTMEGEGNTVESILVVDGKIKAVGNFNIVKKPSNNPTLIDLNGDILLPAFLDCHSHVT